MSSVDGRIWQPQGERGSVSRFRIAGFGLAASNGRFPSSRKNISLLRSLTVRNTADLLGIRLSAGLLKIP